MSHITFFEDSGGLTLTSSNDLVRDGGRASSIEGGDTRTDASEPGSALADIDDIPHLSRELVAKYVRDLEALGSIPTL